MLRIPMFILLICPLALFAENTQLKLYRPFGEAYDQAQVIIRSTFNGHCDMQSKLITREDAWHCEAQGKQYDPCFLSPKKGSLITICPISPWQGDSVQINLSSGLDNTLHKPLNMAEVFPWAIELANGKHCQAVDEHQEYDNMPIRYRCDDKSLLIGYIQRCKPKWSILEKNQMGIVSPVIIKRAWF